MRPPPRHHVRTPAFVPRAQARDGKDTMREVDGWALRSFLDAHSIGVPDETIELDREGSSSRLHARYLMPRSLNIDGRVWPGAGAPVPGSRTCAAWPLLRASVVTGAEAGREAVARDQNIQKLASPSGSARPRRRCGAGTSWPRLHPPPGVRVLNDCAVYVPNRSRSRQSACALTAQHGRRAVS